MDKRDRFRIGIIFNFTKGWLGGFYYYQNIIKALNFLEEEEKPAIIIFYNKDYSEYLSELRYPYLQLIPWEFTSIYKGYILSFITGKNVFVDKMISKYRLNGIYSVNDNPVPCYKAIPKNTIAAAWFPDLQHKFYPGFFDKTRVWLRELRLKQTLKNATDLVVSSHDTVNHFKHFYKIPSSLRIHMLQFVSILDEYTQGDIEKLKVEYKLPPEYFIVSNSFLLHKNHWVVLKALSLLKQKNKPVHVVFTGKMEVYPDSTHIDQLKNFIAVNQLEENVSLLGVIPREDQLCIMKNAKAVLQPSKFEGWNTTIEDAKSQQLVIIASGIAVHKEQLGDKGIYFDPENEIELAQILIDFSVSDIKPQFGVLEERVKEFAKTFLKIFKQM